MDNDCETSVSAPNPQIFVVRLWWERDDGGRSGEWRGWVEHVLTHERRYFREIENVAEFIHNLLAKQETNRREK